MSEEVLVEPGGWLAEHQRAHCAGATALSTYQGLINDEIVLPKSAADAADPAQLVLAANALVSVLRDQAHFIAGEFAPEALWSFYAHDYITQAQAAGHERYYALRGGDLIAIRCVGSALKSMLADPHLEIFNLMVRVKRSAPRDAKRFAVQAGYRDVAAALRDLDKRLAELEAREPLMPRHKAWLKSLRKVKLVPDAEMNGHIQRIGGSNRLLVPRRQEAERIRAEAQRNDPVYAAARRLCEMAGLQFAGLGAGAFASLRDVWPDGPDRSGYALPVATERGQHTAFFYVEGGLFKKRIAVLIQPGESLPSGSLTLSKSEYEAVVPSV